jgi:hypothetical protein
MSAIKQLTTIRVPNPVSADDIAEGQRNLRYLRKLNEIEEPDEDPDNVLMFSYRNSVVHAFLRNYAWNASCKSLMFKAGCAAAVVSSTVPFHVFETNAALLYVEEQCARVAKKFPEEFTTTRPVLNLGFDAWIARVLAPNDRTWYETLAEKANVVVLAHQETASDKNPQ